MLCIVYLLYYVNKHQEKKIYYLYSYHNWWQLASENPIGTVCVVSRHFVFFFLYIFMLSQYACCNI